MPKRDYIFYEKKAKSYKEVGFAQQAFLDFPHAIEYVPFNFLETNFGSLIKKSDIVLELGAGIGNMTGYLLQKTEHLTVMDFSPNSLEVLKKRWPQVREISLANLEEMPFKDCSFDVVVGFSVLSYANKRKVDLEIARVLKPGGKVIIIDSLRGNPLYSLNRLFYVISGRRSLYSVINMPGKSRIKTWNSYHETISLNFFGTFMWLKPILELFWDSSKTSDFLSLVDKNKQITNSSSAFKFLYIGRKRSSHDNNCMYVFHRPAKTISVVSIPKLQDLATSRVPLNIHNIRRLHFARSHYFHLLCKIKKGPCYYFLVKSEKEIIFSTLIHQCIFGGFSSELSKTSFSAVYTHPRFRSQGIASYYLTEEIHKNLKGRDLIWVCRPDNVASIKLCRKIGFTHIGKRHGVKTLFLTHWIFRRSI